MTERQVKLFRNGRNQVVRIPREFELPGRAAVMRKEGERLIIEPAAPRSLLALLDSWDDLGEDERFPEIASIRNAYAFPVQAPLSASFCRRGSPHRSPPRWTRSWWFASSRMGPDGVARLC